VVPSCSDTDAACSSCAMCLRSVSRRSPPTKDRHASGQPLVDRDRLGQGGDAAQPEHARPLVQAPEHLLPLGVVGRSDP
jgi:hypothetical protein